MQIWLDAKSRGRDVHLDKGIAKFTRRLKEEPLIPLGMALTVGALVGATRAMRKGDHHRTNIMFRRRIYAQFFTIVTLCAYAMYYEKDRGKRKELEAIEKEKESAYKRERMIAELEAREMDEKVARARNEKLRERRRLREEAQKAKAQERDASGHSDSKGAGPLDNAAAALPADSSTASAGTKDSSSSTTRLETAVAGDLDDKKQSPSLLDQAASLLGKGKK
jgi:hypothetical protein